jgi:hypothetical protein
MASDLHLQHIEDFDYGEGTFELAHEGDAPARIVVAFNLHPQHIVDSHYSGGTFELAHRGGALIQGSQWPPTRIPNSSPSRERFKLDELIL